MEVSHFLFLYFILLGLYSFHTEFEASSLLGTTRFWWGCDCDCHCHCDAGKQSQLLVFWTWLGLEFDNILQVIRKQTFCAILLVLVVNVGSVPKRKYYLVDTEG